MSVRTAVRVPALNGSGLASVGAAALVGGGLGVALGAPGLTVLPAPLVVGAAAALVVTTLVVFVSPLVALGLGVFLLAVVPVDPAPVDVVMIVLVTSTVLVGGVRPRLPAIVAVPLAGFVVVSLLSTVAAEDTGRALSFEATTLYLVALAVWLSWAFGFARAVSVAVLAYLGAAVLSAAAAVTALYVGFPGSDAFLYDDARASALFQDPNVFGPFLVPAAAVLFEEIGTPRLLRLPRAVVTALFAITTAGVVVAFSRAGWLSYAIAIATVLLVAASTSGGRTAFRASLRALVIAAAAGLVLLAATGSLGFLDERTGLKQYDSDRFGSQGAAFDELARTVIGHGPGHAEEGLAVSTHSIYARAAYEQGWLGLLLIVLVILATLVVALRLVAGRRTVHGVGSAALLGTWLGLIANSAFVDTLHWRHLWFFAALIWAGGALGERKADDLEADA